MPIPIRAALAVAFALSLAAPAAAQPGEPKIPASLLAQFRRDIASGETYPGEEAELPQALRLDGRVDLDGDGRREWVLASTGLFCGATGNCTFWIYRQLPGGGWKRLHEGFGYGVKTLARRTNGFRDIYSDSHFSAIESYRTTHAFDGEKYAWMGTELRVAAEQDKWTTAYRVWSTVPERRAGRAPEPRTVVFSPIPLGETGIRVSAEYTACPAVRATPGALCGEARLLLAGSGSAPWPASPACFTLLGVPWEGPARAAGELCPAAGSSGAAVALAPTKAQWDAIYDFNAPSLELRKGAYSLLITTEDHARAALRDFVTAVYDLNGIEPPGMSGDEEEAAEPGTSNGR